MIKLGSWTVIFRGNIYRNIYNMLIRLYISVVIILKGLWQIIRWSLRIILFIIGINWFEVERLIQRKLRIYFT